MPESPKNGEVILYDSPDFKGNKELYQNKINVLKNPVLLSNNVISIEIGPNTQVIFLKDDEIRKKNNKIINAFKIYANIGKQVMKIHDCYLYGIAKTILIHNSCLRSFHPTIFPGKVILYEKSNFIGLPITYDGNMYHKVPELNSGDVSLILAPKTVAVFYAQIVDSPGNVFAIYANKLNQDVYIPYNNTSNILTGLRIYIYHKELHENFNLPSYYKFNYTDTFLLILLCTLILFIITFLIRKCTK
jgi:hypothetical protein